MPPASGFGPAAQAATTSASPSSVTARSNHGAFHEALNFAAVQRAPAVFVCENNLYATATPLRSITLNPEIATKAASYGMPGVAVDGNDVLAVWPAMSEATERARRGDGPTLIEAKTYRTVGHHEGDPVVGTYRTQEEIDAWIKRDPVDMFRRRLVEDFRAPTPAELAAIEARIETVVEDGARVRALLAGAGPRDRPRATSSPIRSTRPRRSARGWPARRGPKAGSRRCATASPRRCGPTPPFSTSAKAPASGAAASPIPRTSGRSSERSGWSIRRSPSRASPRPRSAPRRQGHGRCPT